MLENSTEETQAAHPLLTVTFCGSKRCREMEAGQRTFDELTKGHTPDGLSPVTIEIEGVRIRVRRAAACIGACRREPAAVVSVEGHTHRPLSVSAVTAQDVISTVMQFIGALSVRLPQKTEESA